jgi:hypothetical protein
MTTESWNNLKVGDKVLHRLSKPLKGKELTITSIWEKPTSGFVGQEMKHGLTLELQKEDGTSYHTSGLDPKLYSLVGVTPIKTTTLKDIRESPSFGYPFVDKIWNWFKNWRKK